MFKIEIPFYPYSHHLEQLYSGFEMLKKRAIVNIVYTNELQPYNKINIVKARVNDRFDVIYDLFDGTDWILGETLQKNLEYYKQYLQSDYYFKRSFNNEFYEKISEFTQVKPFGFNYPVNIKQTVNHKIVNVFKELIDYPFFHKHFNFNTHSVQPIEVEHLPIPNRINKIIFFVRLWDPSGQFEKLESNQIKEEREHINLSRVNYIKACKNEFGELFLGGVQDIPFSRKYCPDLIVPRFITNRRTYLKTLKESNICIATTGLHGSTGWKFGEYIAASRAIVSEPLNFLVPGNFTEGINYLKFSTKNELIDNVSVLLHNPLKMTEMMFANYSYYQEYLRPDMLVLNSLLNLYDDFTK